MTQVTVHDRKRRTPAAEPLLGDRLVLGLSGRRKEMG
jgi:hypothetical protein